MAGHGQDDDPSLKGIARIFNSQTNKGRANTTKVTMGLIAAVIFYHKFLKRAPKKKAPTLP